MATTKQEHATGLAAHVLLAFDDFSHAGRALLKHVEIKSHRKELLVLPSTLPASLTDRLTGYQYLQDNTNDAKLSVLVIDTAQSDGTALWETADALVQFLSAGNIDKLTVVASLHLPQAKPHAAPLDNVYHGVLTTSASSSSSKFQSFDSAWEIKDDFFCRLLHLTRVEQAFETHFMVMKGYKPGRSGVATREAIETLAKATPLYLNPMDATVDVQEAVLSAYASLAHQPSASNLLYQ